MNPLLKSYKFSRNNKSVNNRIVLASMTNLQSYSDGFLSENEINWLYERAKGGFGILITAATNVSKDGQAWDGEFGVYDDKFIDGLKQLTKTIHKTNSKIYAQLFHGGLRCPETITGSTPISPSVVDCKESFNGKSNSASKVDIRRIINDFANSAVRCYKAGFDGIELHGAHGYLISQFFGKKTNQRNDQYGGNMGTSMAAPVVAGVAGLIRHINPDLSAAEVKELLIENKKTNPFIEGKVKDGAMLDFQQSLIAAFDSLNANF